MGVFGGIDKARASGSGRYFVPGLYKLEVKELKVIPSQQKSTDFFVATFEILSYQQHASMDGKPEFASGEEVTWLVDMDQKSALGNIKGFGLALLPGSKDEDITEEVMEGMIGPEQPGSGVIVEATAINVKTRAGNDFTKINWRCEGVLDKNAAALPLG